MADLFTEEQLKNMENDELAGIAMSLQERLAAMEKNYKNLDHTVQLMMEQLADAKRRRFGRSTEKLEEMDGQISFCETEDGIVYFNEAEAVADSETDDELEEGLRPNGAKNAEASARRTSGICL